MVIKGSARAEAGKLAGHLLRTDTNESMNVRELLGVVSPDLTEALREMEAVASAARSRRPFYHASINTAANELMTDAQKARAIDRLEAELGLTGQPRVVVEHVKESREHLHVAWSRIDGDTLRVIPDSHNYRRHEIVARELEREFGHARVQGAHHERDGVARPDRRPSHAETRQSERSGLTPEQAKDRLRELWQSADSGQAFASALDHAGWILAEGDKRGFVALDPTGEVRAVNKDITGLTAAKVRERLSDIDPARLPSVDAARNQLRDRLREAEALRVAEPQVVERVEPDLEPVEPPAACEAILEAEPAQGDQIPPKSPEDMRREWAALMRDDKAAPEPLAEPAHPARPDRQARPVPEQNQAEATPCDHKTQAVDPAVERKVWADRLRKFEALDPTAERKVWATRLRDLADEKPSQAVDQRQERAYQPRPEMAAKPSQAERKGLFERIRSFVRSWWEPKETADPKPDRAVDRRNEDKPIKPAVESLSSASPAKPSATPPQPVEPVRRRSVSQEMLDEAQASIDAARAAETPTQRTEREGRPSNTTRGRDHGIGDRGRYHHSLLLDLPPPWQHRRTHTQNRHLQP